MTPRQLVERVEVHRRVLANRGVRTAAGLHADDPVGGQRLAAHQELHVFPREDVVGHHAELIAVAHALAQRVDQRGLARADRTADAEPNSGAAHDRNNLECTYCWLIAAMSISGVNARGGALRRAQSCRDARRHVAQHVARADRAPRADRSASAASPPTPSPRAACSSTPRARPATSTPDAAQTMPNATGSVQRGRASQCAARTTADGRMSLPRLQQPRAHGSRRLAAGRGRAHRVDLVVESRQGRRNRPLGTLPTRRARRDPRRRRADSSSVAPATREDRRTTTTPPGGDRPRDRRMCERADRKQAVAEMQQGEPVVAHVSASLVARRPATTGVNGRMLARERDRVVVEHLFHARQCRDRPARRR